eukprot:TRINITY_DN1093_c6_g1_i1.p1 TRINITY_DN1093_c6_g1~~TRINITY_DN1093_c6_g1_i1.p1  ORF type:complete len:404 (+),score=70.05 TRINITY_DN1093_c6_g1_i1:64-1212(+)
MHLRNFRPLSLKFEKKGAIWPDSDTCWYLKNRYLTQLRGDPRASSQVFKGFQHDWAIIQKDESYIKHQKTFLCGLVIAIKTGHGSSPTATAIWNKMIEKHWDTPPALVEKIMDLSRKGRKPNGPVREEIAKILRETQCGPTTRVYEAVLKALLAHSDMDTADKVFQKMTSSGCRGLSEITGEYLAAKSQNLQKTVEKLREMKIPISLQLAITLIHKHPPPYTELTPYVGTELVRFFSAKTGREQVSTVRRVYNGNPSLEYAPPPWVCLQLLLKHAPTSPHCASTAQLLFPSLRLTPSVFLTYARIASFSRHPGRASWVFNIALAEGYLAFTCKEFMETTARTLKSGGMDEKARQVEKMWKTAKRNEWGKRGKKKGKRRERTS